MDYNSLGRRDSVKVKLICDKEDRNEIKELLSKTISFVEEEEADFILIKKEFYEREQKTINGFLNQTYHRIQIDDILYFEAIKASVYAYTDDYQYLLKEKLYEIELKFTESCLRVNKSSVVNIQKISKIKPHINRKFILTMTNGHKIDVTRTYYLIFKEHFGI